MYKTCLKVPKFCLSKYVSYVFLSKEPVLMSINEIGPKPFLISARPIYFLTIKPEVIHGLCCTFSKRLHNSD